MNICKKCKHFRPRPHFLLCNDLCKKKPIKQDPIDGEWYWPTCKSKNSDGCRTDYQEKRSIWKLLKNLLWTLKTHVTPPQ